MNIDHFNGYCNKKFGLREKERKIREEAKRPEIPLASIFKSVREMPVLGQTSLLSVDQYARSPEARRWHASDRKMVTSDTALERRLGGMDQESVMEIGYEAIQKLAEQGYWDWRLPTGRKIRVGIVDGSDFGGFWASVLVMTGASDGVLDLEPYQGRGHELGASRKVLRRAREKLGKGFCDVVVTDGLYRTEKDFRLCRRELGCDLLVKTDEESLTVIQDARSLFFPRNEKIREGVNQVKGIDSERQVSYEVLWAEGFESRDGSASPPPALMPSRWEGIRTGTAAGPPGKPGAPSAVEGVGISPDGRLGAGKVSQTGQGQTPGRGVLGLDHDAGTQGRRITGARPPEMAH